MTYIFRVYHRALFVVAKTDSTMLQHLNKKLYCREILISCVAERNPGPIQTKCSWVILYMKKGGGGHHLPTTPTILTKPPARYSPSRILECTVGVIYYDRGKQKAAEGIDGT